jgi:hypothetical protein
LAPVSTLNSCGVRGGFQGGPEPRHDGGDVATPPVLAEPFQGRQLCVPEHTLTHRTDRSVSRCDCSPQPGGGRHRIAPGEARQVRRGAGDALGHARLCSVVHTGSPRGARSGERDPRRSTDNGASFARSRCRWHSAHAHPVNLGTSQRCRDEHGRWKEFCRRWSQGSRLSRGPSVGAPVKYTAGGGAVAGKVGSNLCPVR